MPTLLTRDALLLQQPMPLLPSRQTILLSLPSDMSELMLIVTLLLVLPVLAMAAEDGLAGKSDGASRTGLVTLTIDPATTHQMIDGLRAAVFQGESALAIYEKPESAKDLADVLGVTMVRISLSPPHLEAKKTPAEISWKDFDFQDRANRGNSATGARLMLTPNTIPVLEFVKRLQAHNPEIKVIGSVWSPPEWMKSNNSLVGGKLKPECYPHFAKYLAEWYRFAREKFGITLYAISPQSQPVYFGPGESCGYGDHTPEYRNMLAVMADVFKHERIDVKVFGNEDTTAHWGRTKGAIKEVMADPKAGPRLDVFASRNYLDGIATGNMEYSTMFWNELKTYKRPYWMTEMQYKSDLGWKDGLPKDESAVKNERGEGALAPLVRLNQGALNGIGGRLHFALVYGDCSAWVFGQIVNPGYKESAGFPVIQQFYRFIRPGMYRIDAGPDGERNICVSAWLDPKTRASAVVLINRGPDARPVALEFKSGFEGVSFAVRRSSETERFADCGEVAVRGGNTTLTMPPFSIVTLSGGIGKSK